MQYPPDDVLKAALRVLHVCAYTTRNWTLQEEIPRRQVHDLWEAVHEIPDLLTRWQPKSMDELIGYLDEYDAKWPAPCLREIFSNSQDEGAV